MGSAASSFIIDDAIIGLAQPLTEALNQLASGPRRACDVIEELSRREHFYLDLAGGSSGRTAGAVFHNAHLPYKLPCADPAEKDRVAIEFPEYVDGTAEEAKNSVRPRTCPSAKCLQITVVLSIAIGGGSKAPLGKHIGAPEVPTTRRAAPNVLSPSGRTIVILVRQSALRIQFRRGGVTPT